MNGPQRKRGGPIDWPAVRDTLQRMHEAVDTELSPEQARAILDERARVLSRPRSAAPDSPEPPLAVLTFALGVERYAIETKYVREVVRQLDFTPVPGVPDFVVGVTNHRGQILCVVNLQRFFGATPMRRTGSSRIIVMGNETAEIGALVERIDAIDSLPASELLSPSESVAGMGHEHLLGVTRHALLVLNGAQLLQDSRLLVDQRETGTR